jgi:hypothetical protein
VRELKDQSYYSWNLLADDTCEKRREMQGSGDKEERSSECVHQQSTDVAIKKKFAFSRERHKKRTTYSLYLQIFCKREYFSFCSPLYKLCFYKNALWPSYGRMSMGKAKSGEKRRKKNGSSFMSQNFLLFVLSKRNALRKRRE